MRVCYWCDNLINVNISTNFLDSTGLFSYEKLKCLSVKVSAGLRLANNIIAMMRIENRALPLMSGSWILK